MSDNNDKITGNEVVSSDFVRVLLALKDSAMKDTHCLELAVVKSIDEDKVICELLSNPSMRVQAIRFNDMELTLNQIVLIGFNDNDFKSNLNKMREGDNTLQASTSKKRHDINNGIIITNFNGGGGPGSDTWRPIKVNGENFLDNSIEGYPLDITAGNNITLSILNGKIIFDATDTTYSNLPEEENGTDVSLVTTGDKYRWNRMGVTIDDTIGSESISANGKTLNVVTRDTEQTISALKKFNIRPRANSLMSGTFTDENETYSITYDNGDIINSTGFPSGRAWDKSQTSEYEFTLLDSVNTTLYHLSYSRYESNLDYGKWRLRIEDLINQTTTNYLLERTEIGYSDVVLKTDLLDAFQDKSKTVTNVTYDNSTRKLKKHYANSIEDIMTLSKVATSNDYDDLDNKPTYGKKLAVSGTSLSLLDENDNVLNTVTTKDTGAIQVGNSTSYETISDYINWTTTDEYVGFYVLYNNTRTLVTNSNKDSLNITPGTTQALAAGNAVTHGGYDVANRAVQLLIEKRLIDINDIDNVLNDKSIFPVQNKILARLIPGQASSSNQLADKDFVNSSINALAAFFITRDAQGDNFNTYSQLINTTTFYSGGQVRIPTTNDYTYVRWDESKGDVISGYSSFTTTTEYVGHYVIYNNEGVEVTLTNKDSIGITPGTTICYDNLPTTRYSYQGGTYPNGQWNFQLIVNNSAFTAAQLAAINSGITAALVAQILQNQNDISTLDRTAVTNVQFDSVNNKITKTINGTVIDVVTFGDNAFNSTHFSIYKGIYDDTVQYYANDIVTYDNMTFICLQDTIGNYPYTNSSGVGTYWRNINNNSKKVMINSFASSGMSLKIPLISGGSPGDFCELGYESDRLFLQESGLYANGKKLIDENNLFPAYSSSSTYDVGDIVIRNHTYFKCITAITTPENWTSAHWTATTFQDMFDDKQDVLVSGVTLKTINGNSLLGSGDLTVGGGGGSTDVQVDGTSITSDGVANLATMNGDYDADTNPFVTESDILTEDPVATAPGVTPLDNYYTKSEVYSKVESENTFANKNLTNVTATRSTSTVTRGGKSGTLYTGKHLCIESWKSTDGTLWYRKYDDGWKECGGYTTNGQTPTNVDYTQTLPISFNNSNYTLIFKTCRDDLDTSGNGLSVQYAHAYYGVIWSKTSSSFKFRTGTKASWYACGY